MFLEIPRNCVVKQYHYDIRKYSNGALGAILLTNILLGHVHVVPYICGRLILQVLGSASNFSNRPGFSKIHFQWTHMHELFGRCIQSFQKVHETIFFSRPTNNTFQMWLPPKTFLNFLSHQELFSNQNVKNPFKTLTRHTLDYLKSEGFCF